jgi:hypothetical protein
MLVDDVLMLVDDVPMLVPTAALGGLPEVLRQDPSCWQPASAACGLPHLAGPPPVLPEVRVGLQRLSQQQFLPS